jgi:hypothetical protein
MEKIRQDTSPNALRGIEICESRGITISTFFDLSGVNDYSGLTLMPTACQPAYAPLPKCVPKK